MIGGLIGGGGGGGCASILGTTEQIGSGTSTSTSVPFYGLYDYSVYAGIWESSEFTSGDKQITGIELELGGYTTPYTYNNVKIYMGHVAETTFDSDPAVDGSDLTITDETLCFDGSITISSNGFVTINFGVSNFCYDQTKNLYMRIENRDGTWQSGYGHGKYAVSISKAMYKATDDSYPTGNGILMNARVNTKFKI